MIQWRIFHIYVGLLEGNPPWPRRKGRWPQSGPWKFPQRIHHSTWGRWLCFVVWLQQRITQAFHKTNLGFYEMVNLEGMQAWAINGYNPGHNSVTWDLSPATMAKYLVVPSIKKKKNLHNTQAVWTIPILEVPARRWIQLNVNLVQRWDDKQCLWAMSRCRNQKLMTICLQYIILDYMLLDLSF